jgi:hypothetical protein
MVIRFPGMSFRPDSTTEDAADAERNVEFILRIGDREHLCSLCLTSLSDMEPADTDAGYGEQGCSRSPEVILNILAISVANLTDTKAVYFDEGMAGLTGAPLETSQLMK